MMTNLVFFPAEDEYTKYCEGKMYGSIPRLDVLVEENKVYLRIIAPSQLLVGTELKPKTDKEKIKYAKNIEKLAKLMSIIEFPDSAKCKVVLFTESSPNLMGSSLKYDNINTTLLYDVMCENPSRLTTVKSKIFESYDSLNNVCFRWKSNGNNNIYDFGEKK